MLHCLAGHFTLAASSIKLHAQQTHEEYDIKDHEGYPPCLPAVAVAFLFVRHLLVLVGSL